MKITPTDREAYWFVRNYITEHGWSPSITDITEGVGCARATAHLGLHRLAAAGLIVLGEGPRTIRVVGSKVDMKGAPDVPR